MEPERIVIRFFLQIAICVSLSLVSAMASADLRVLLRFDESGHRVHSLIKAPTRQVLRKQSLSEAQESARTADSGHTLSIDERVEVARAHLHKGAATLLWFDASGAWLSNSEEPDPRVTHAPAHIDGVNKSQAGLSQGAWLATGPDAAAQVTILFPAHLTLALGAEEWHVSLSAD